MAGLEPPAAKQASAIDDVAAAKHEVSEWQERLKALANAERPEAITLGEAEGCASEKGERVAGDTVDRVPSVMIPNSGEGPQHFVIWLR